MCIQVRQDIPGKMVEAEDLNHWNLMHSSPIPCQHRPDADEHENKALSELPRTLDQQRRAMENPGKCKNANTDPQQGDCRFGGILNHKVLGVKCARKFANPREWEIPATSAGKDSLPRARHFTSEFDWIRAHSLDPGCRRIAFTALRTPSAVDAISNCLATASALFPVAFN